MNWLMGAIGLTFAATPFLSRFKQNLLAPFALGLNLDHKTLALSVVLGILVILLAGYQGYSVRPRAK